MHRPLISACIITYNQKDFIQKCLDGILSQITNFDVGIVISDDSSNDGTSEICEEIKVKYPEKIFYYRNEFNLGVMGNWIKAFKRCKGKYIAICEGDDYWTDPNKLQKQVDFLEANQEYSLCFHNCIVSNERTNSVTEYPLINNLTKSTFETEDILQQWFIPTASIVYKQEGFVLPQWFSHVESGDIALLLLISLLGKLKYLDEIMCVYRLHPTGVSVHHAGYRKAIAMTYLYQSFNIYTNYKYKEKINEAIKFEWHLHVIDKLILTKEEETKRVLQLRTSKQRLFSYILEKWFLYKKKILKN